MTKNALKSGFYSTELLLPWESKEEYEALLKQYLNDFFPDCRYEQDAVEEMVFREWKERRLQRAHKMKHSVDVVARDLTKALCGNATAEDLERHVRDLVVAKTQADPLTMQVKAKTKELLDALDGMAANVKQPSESPSPQVGVDNAASTNNRAGDESISRMVTRRVVEQTFQVVDMEKLLKLQGANKAQSDKAFARLVRMKEFRRQYAMKMVDKTAANSSDGSSTVAASTITHLTDSGSSDSGSSATNCIDIDSKDNGSTGSE